MKYTELFLLLLVWIDAGSFAPLNPKEGAEKEEEPIPADSLMDGPQTGLEYEKYLEQVIQILETDPKMREKLEGMTMDDLKSGKMAEEIDLLDNNIRSELDELKRLEIQRLRNIARKRMENGGSRSLDTKFVDNLIGHIDPANTNAFGPKDFEKLLHKATSDLEEADRRRKDDFKKYEMEKELRRRAKLQKLDESERQQAIKEWEDTRNERKNHKQMKHPGSKAQLEDVWEKTDHLEKDQFNPKTFFMLHDTNGDLKLDSFELEALFIKEVEEIYKGSNADPKEKFEEIYRMREHVMKEIDTDGDKLVTLEEFLTATKQDDFEKDDGWEDLQQQELYTEEELEEYRAMYDEVVKEKKEKLKKEQEEYLKRRQEHGAGEPIVMDQKKRVQQLAGEAADEIMKRVEEKKLNFEPKNVVVNTAEDLQAAQKQQEVIAQQQAAKLQQAAQQAAQQQGKQEVPPEVVAEQAKLQAAQAAQEALAKQVEEAKQKAQQAAQQQAAQQAAQQQAAQQQAAQQQAAQQQAAQQQAAQQQAAQQAAQQQAAQQQAAQQQAAQQQAAQQQAAQQQAAQQQAAQQAAQQQAAQQQAGQPQQVPQEAVQKPGAPPKPAA